MTDKDALFWDVAQEHLATGAEKSTMMGLPCLRIEGEFFASMDRETGDLIVKLPADDVSALIDAGTAEPFAPAGRRFREWALIPSRDEGQWQDLLRQARDFVGPDQSD
jgi:hypothetical protein